MTAKEARVCGYCKFNEQGKTCSFCSHPKQTIKAYKEYVYYPFSCDLFENGIAQSRVEYMESLNKETK